MSNHVLKTTNKLKIEMEITCMNVNSFWNDIISQNRDALSSYFCKDAIIR